MDFGADFRGAATSMGRFNVGMSGTLVLNYDRQFGPREPTRTKLGVMSGRERKTLRLSALAESWGRTA